MTQIMPLDPDAPFEERVRYYRALARLPKDIVSGKELRAMGRRWLRENGQSPGFARRNTKTKTRHTTTD